MPLFDLFAGTLDGVFAVNRRQRIVFWNDAARRILGLDPDSVLGRPCYEIVGGTDASGCAVCGKGCATFRASLRGELSPTRDLQVHASHGGREWINLTTFVLPARHQALTLLMHVFRAAGQAATITFDDSDGRPRPFGPLTRAESAVLRLLAAGATTEAICARLNIHVTTARTHVQHIMAKLGVHTRLEAVAFAARSGLLRLPSG